MTCEGTTSTFGQRWGWETIKVSIIKLNKSLSTVSRQNSDKVKKKINLETAIWKFLHEEMEKNTWIDKSRDNDK